MGAPIAVLGRSKRPLAPPSPPPPTPRGGMGEDCPLPPRFASPDRRIRERGVSPWLGGGADLTFPIEGWASPRALPIPSSPTRVSEASLTHRGGQAPPRTPPSPSPANSHLTALLMGQLGCPSASARRSSFAPSSHALRPRFPRVSSPRRSSPASLAGLAEELHLSCVLGTFSTSELRWFLALLPRPS